MTDTEKLQKTIWEQRRELAKMNAKVKEQQAEIKELRKQLREGEGKTDDRTRGD